MYIRSKRVSYNYNIEYCRGKMFNNFYLVFLKVHLTSLEETKNTSLTLISRFYYLQLPNVVDQLLQPLMLPLIHHDAVYGTLPWTKELKALASCRRFLRNSAVQAHVSSVRYVNLWCPVTAHAWNMLVQTTQVKWRTFYTIILFPFS